MTPQDNSSADEIILLKPNESDPQGPTATWLGQLKAPLSPLNKENDRGDKLVLPRMETWLDSSKDSNAVNFVLRLNDLSSESLGYFQELKFFLNRISKPKLFAPLLEVHPPLAPLPTQGAVSVPLQSANHDSLKFPLVVLKNTYKDSLLSSACLYAQDWIRSYQILAAAKIDGPKKFELQCIFILQNELSSDVNLAVDLILTRLALPLLSENQQIFPFQTKNHLEDSALLEKLRIAAP